MIGAATAQARVREAGWLRDADLHDLLAALDGEARRSRVVGGLVRDTILDMSRARTDIDIATELLPEEVTARAERGRFAVYPTGVEHGTVTVRRGTLIAEVTTLRRDVETDGRHAVVRFGTDWFADAARRDFTLNALYADIDGEVFDPLGALADCLNRRVRFIGDPRRRIAEDGLRVLRFFRFTASHGLEVFDAEGLEACAEAAGRLEHLSGERVGSEMLRMLALPNIAQEMGKMAQLGIVDIGAAEIEALRGYERQVANPSVAARLALILGGVAPDALQARWRLSNDEIEAAQALRAAAELIEAGALHEAIYRHPAVAGEALDLVAIRQGWSEAGKAAMREKLSAITLRAFPISGADLLATGMTPGRGLGDTLRRLEREWIESGFALDREALLGRVGAD